MSQPNEPTKQPDRGLARKRVQVAVVIFGSLLLAGLVVAGMVRAREAGARTQCQNNLKIIGQALHNYASASDDSFPAATFPNPALPPERRLSWLFELEPFVHARMDPNWTAHMKEPWDSEGNLKLARSRMPWYLCPAAPATTDADGLALTHYVGLLGVGADAGTRPKHHPRRGAFNYEYGSHTREFQDGAWSFFVAETAFENGPWMAGGRPTARPFELTGLQPIGKGGQFGGLHRGGGYILGGSGFVSFVRDTASPTALAAYITIGAGDYGGALPID